MKKYDFFQAALEADQKEQQQLEAQNRKFMTGRLVLFLALLLAAAASWDYRSIPLYVLSFLLLGSFIFLLRRHSQLRGQQTRLRNHTAVLQEYLARCTGQWHNFQDTGERYFSETVPQSLDLNLFGPDSLYQYLCTARTKAGCDLLAAVLSPLPSAANGEIRQRQQSVRELMKRPELMLELLSVSRQRPRQRQGQAGDLVAGQMTAAKSAIVEIKESFQAEPLQFQGRPCAAVAGQQQGLITIAAVQMLQNFAHLGQDYALTPGQMK